VTARARARRFIAAAIGVALGSVAPVLAHEPLWGETPVIFGPGVIHPEIKIRLVRTGGTPDPGDMRSRMIEQECGLQYGINRFVNVQIMLPVTSMDLDENIAGTVQRTRVSGMGDAMLKAKYRFHLRQEVGFQTAQTLVAGWKIPTGSDQRTGPDGSRLPPGDQPGSARHGIEIGYAYDRERLANSFWASLFFDHEFGDGFRRGDAGELDATYGWWLLRPNVAEELGVNLAVGLHAEASASDRLDGGASALTAHRVAGIHLTPIITKGRNQYRVGLFVPVFKGGNTEETDFGYEIRAGWEMFF